MFYDENLDLTFTNVNKHKHPESMEKEINKQIQQLLQNQIIRLSISPYSPPFWIVPKKGCCIRKKIANVY